MTTREQMSRPTVRSGRRAVAALACATVLAGTGVAALATSASASASTEDAAATHPKDPAVQRVTRAVLASGGAGYLTRIDDGRHVTTSAAGLADRATGRALRATDQFEVGSNTKTFVSTLALQEVARGRLSLGDRLATYFPGIVPNSEQITLRQLLQHTSGVVSYTADPAFFTRMAKDPQHVYTRRELLAVANHHRPDFAPGHGWNYSNTNYVLVGMILEKVTGHSVADLIQHRIARPLGLTHTYYADPRVRNTGPGYAHAYVARFTGSKPTYADVSDQPIGGWADAAGSVVSTSDELARFFSALLGGTLLPPAQLAEMKTTVPLPQDFPIPGAYGLGLFRKDTPCGSVWGHGGDTLGHHSTAVVSDDGRRTAVTDTNTEPSDVDGLTPGTERFIRVAFAAEDASVCRMLDKPLPAAVAKALA
jgi:D-alanyl-D-alanine carboxypeptidase